MVNGRRVTGIKAANLYRPRTDRSCSKPFATILLRYSPQTSPESEKQQNVKSCWVESFTLRLVFDFYVFSRLFSVCLSKVMVIKNLASQLQFLCEKTFPFFSPIVLPPTKSPAAACCTAHLFAFPIMTFFSLEVDFKYNWLFQAILPLL